MPIKPTYKQKQFEKLLDKKVIELQKSIIKALFRLGEECVKMSRLGLNIDPSAFPIDYGDDEVKKPLQTQGWRISITKKLKKRTDFKQVNLGLGEYMDQTGNLRSSIGYVIVANGIIVTKNFKGSDSEGISKGYELAVLQSHRFKKGFALIVVAGMKYAVHVESKGYNVIASSEKYAKNNIQSILSQLA